MGSALTRRDLITLNRPCDSGSMVHIASLLVHFDPRVRDSVAAAAAVMPGAELHETARPDKVALVLESSDERAIAQAAHELSEVSGVINVSIVAHLMESETALEEDVESEPAAVPAK